MSTFLETIAKAIHAERSEAWHTYTIVVPGRRGGLFLSKALLSLAGRPILAPEILSPADVFQRASEMQPADDLQLLAYLYQCHRVQSGSDEPFSDFYPWGEKLLRDFDNVDKALADSNQVFATLRSEREITERFSSLEPEKRKEIQDFWMGMQQDPSILQQRFLKLWECLPEVYTQFRATLESEGVGYSGLIQRNVIEGQVPLTFSGPVWVVGFSGLSACERALFLRLKREFGAKFYWDDLPDFPESHPSRRLILQNVEQFGGIVIGSESRPKRIQIIQADREEGQATALGAYLKPGIESGVIFPRASLLPAVLEHLDELHLPINISMGYPLRYSLVATFLDALHVYWRQSKGCERAARLPLLHVLTHPFAAGQGKVWQKELSHQKADYVSLNSLPEPDSYEAQLRNVLEQSNPLQQLLHWFPQLQAGEGLEGQAKQAFVFRLRRLNDVVQGISETLEPGTLWKIIATLSRNGQLPLTGEPLSGTQMLGLLETSVLDFKYLYVLQTNEGALPSSVQEQSLIPFHIRLAYGIQLPEQMLAEEAYLFFRLCQRAEEIVLFYNGTQQGTEKAEPSRFLLYLEQLNPWSLTTERFSPRGVNAPKAVPTIEISKHPEVLTVLDAMRDRISPTALNTYMYCSLRFYFKHIMRLKEKREPEEGVDPMVFGDLLHRSMDLLYKNNLGVGHWVTADDFARLNTADIIRESINEVLPEIIGGAKHKSVKVEGEWVLVLQAVEMYMRALIQWDAAQAPMQFLGLEEKRKLELTLHDGRTVAIEGIVDRIDVKRTAHEEVLRILDYKTGSDKLGGSQLKRKFQSISQLFDKEEPRRAEVFQVLLYSLIMQRENPELPIEPGLIFLRAVENIQADSRLELDKVPIQDVRLLLPDFQTELTALLEEIFNDSVPFTQITDVSKCEWCPYKAICAR